MTETAPDNLRARFFSRKRLMILGIIVSSIPTTAVVVALPVGNFCVETEWNRFRTHWEGQGEVFDLKALFDTPVADADNFAKAPIISEVYRQAQADTHDHRDHDHHGHDHSETASPDGPPMTKLGSLTYFSDKKVVMMGSPLNFAKGEPANLSIYLPEESPTEKAAPADALLAAFAPYDAVFSELLEAAQRPDAYFPVSSAGPYQTRLPHMPLLITALHGLRIQTLALIDSQQNDPEKAAERTAGILRTIRLGTDCQGLPTYVIRTLAIESAGLETVWQGLYRRRFDDAQWDTISRELSAFEFGPRLMQSLRYERAALVWKVESECSDGGRLRHFSLRPSWTDLASLLEYGELTQRHWFTNPAGQTPLRDWPDLDQFAAIEAVAAATPQIDENTVLLSGIQPVREFAQRAQWIEDQRDHALVAIALERHRLATGAYPESLSALVPKWLSDLPGHRSTGHPPRYEILAEGKGYRLRAMGESSELSDAVWIMPPAGGQMAPAAKPTAQ